MFCLLYHLPTTFNRLIKLSHSMFVMQTLLSKNTHYYDITNLQKQSFIIHSGSKVYLHYAYNSLMRKFHARFETLFIDMRIYWMWIIYICYSFFMIKISIMYQFDHNYTYFNKFNQIYTIYRHSRISNHHLNRLTTYSV